MKILVIGSNGFIGKNLVYLLKQNSHFVETNSSKDPDGINTETGIFPKSFCVAGGTECVIYLAQSPLYNQTPQFASHVLSVNAVSAVHCATKAMEAGAKRFIYISTGSVYAPTFLSLCEHSQTAGNNWYTLSKLQGEEALLALRDEIDIILVRPFGVYGPKQTGRLIPSLIKSITNGQPIILSAKEGEGKECEGLGISLCHVNDASQTLAFLASHGGPGILNLAGDEILTIRAMAEEIGQILGISPLFEISDRPRKFDLIADVTLLHQTFDHQFLGFREGLSTL